MRPTQEHKLLEAQQAVYHYQFHAAYQHYRQAFSLLPFQINDNVLEHVGLYVRVLLELDRLEELKFYLPILESHFAKIPSTPIAYALGYMNYVVGSRTRARELLELTAARPGENHDFRIKAVMLLARLTNVDAERVQLIYSIKTPARDPILSKLLEVWRCIILRYQGQTPRSIEGLHRLIATINSKTEWYCLLSAKDALVRAYINLSDFNNARREIEEIASHTDWMKLRTVVMQRGDLNTEYKQFLSRKTILAQNLGKSVALTHGSTTIRIQQEPVQKLVHLFNKKPSLTLKKAMQTLALDKDQFDSAIGRFSERLGELSLPSDSIDWQGSKLHLIPSVRFEANHGGRL